MGTVAAAIVNSLIDNLIGPLIAWIAKVPVMPAWTIPLGIELNQTAEPEKLPAEGSVPFREIRDSLAKQ